MFSLLLNRKGDLPGNPVQWLGLHVFTAEGLGSIPALGTKSPQATLHGRKKKALCIPQHMNILNH